LFTRHTNRSYFDLLVKTSAEGKFPAYEGGQCKYRTSNGLKCGVGVIVPDEIYCDLFDHNEFMVTGIIYLNNHLPNVLKLKEWIPEGMTILELADVQKVHDSNSSPYYLWDHDNFVKQLLKLPCFAKFA
jgi:hypothetical protein